MSDGTFFQLSDHCPPSRDSHLKISAVIPTYNEVDSLRKLHAELADVAERNGYDLEFVFVDDGSTDGSWDLIRQLAAVDARVRGIRFRRNFGKAAALRAGFEASQGELIVTLDADLQDDPAEIPKFLAKINEERLDVVSGWKQVRHDPWHKVGPSRVFNRLVGMMTGVKLHDHNCGMKCYRRAVVEEVRIYGELHRFIPVLAHALGFQVGEVTIQHRPRQYGRSKYGFRRFFKGFLDLLTVTFITGFGHRPQHLLGTLGMLCFLAGGVGVVITALLSDGAPRTLLFSAIALLCGVQLTSIGFLAELLRSHQGSELDTFSVKERTDDEAGVAEPVGATVSDEART